MGHLQFWNSEFINFLPRQVTSRVNDLMSGIISTPKYCLQ